MLQSVYILNALDQDMCFDLLMFWSILSEGSKYSAWWYDTNFTLTDESEVLTVTAKCKYTYIPQVLFLGTEYQGAQIYTLVIYL